MTPVPAQPPKAIQQDWHGQQQQRHGVKQDGENGPAFHAMAEFSHQVQPRASEIGA